MATETLIKVSYISKGEKLKMLRTGQKLSQRKLAKRLGVTKSVISYYESGDRYPSYDVLIRMAHLFHVTTDYLLDIGKEDIYILTTPYFLNLFIKSPNFEPVETPFIRFSLFVKKVVASVACSIDIPSLGSNCNNSLRAFSTSANIL